MYCACGYCVPPIANDFQVGSSCWSACFKKHKVRVTQYKKLKFLESVWMLISLRSILRLRKFNLGKITLFYCYLYVITAVQLRHNDFLPSKVKCGCISSIFYVEQNLTYNMY